MKRIAIITAAFSALLAGIGISGCSKDNVFPVAETASVALPPLSVEKKPVNGRGIFKIMLQTGPSSDENPLHTLCRDIPGIANAREQAALPSRADHPALNNVWVLQFDAQGHKLQCYNLGTVAENSSVAATLTVAEGCTIYILAEGPVSGLDPADLTAFESMGEDPASAGGIVYSGRMKNIRVVNHNGQGHLVAKDGTKPTVWLRPTHAVLKVGLNLSVTGWEMVSMALFNVPGNIRYAQTDEAIYPEADAGRFLHTDKVPAQDGWICGNTITTDGMVSGSWNIPENRRGMVPGIAQESDRDHTNSPAYSTCVRIRIRSASEPAKSADFYIYPGGSLTDFNLIRNHTYNLEVNISGTEEDLWNYAQTDERVTVTFSPSSGGTHRMPRNAAPPKPATK